MVNLVVKRRGREEPFAFEKVVVSVMKAGAPLEEARKVAKRVECRFLDQEKVSAKDLTKAILTELRKVNEEWYRNWIVFDRAVKRRETEKEMQE
jgi:transcriptional regulator NrdR family protein